MKNIFEARTIEEALASIDEVRSQTDEAGFSIIRGVVSDKDIEEYRQKVHDFYSLSNEMRISGEFTKGAPDAQRLDLGEYPASSRFARYFFFFPWNNESTFSSIGEAQMRIFNQLSRQDESFCFEGDSDPRRYRLSFVIQYPIGGGFMSKHREYSKAKDDKAYVVYLALTTRGVDFQTGGAYACVGDKVVDIEEHVRAGDLVIYRGDMYHGVLGVDKHAPVEMGKICGRQILTTVAKYLPEGPKV